MIAEHFLCYWIPYHSIRSGINYHDNGIHQQFWSPKNFVPYHFYIFLTLLLFHKIGSVGMQKKTFLKLYSFWINTMKLLFLTQEDLNFHLLQQSLPGYWMCTVRSRRQGKATALFCSQGRCHLAGTVLQRSLPESRLCSGHVRPSHVSWHSGGISSFCPSAPLPPHRPKRSLTSKKKLEMSPCTVNTLRVQLSAS